MKPVCLALALILASPAHAEAEGDAFDQRLNEGLSLMDQGARLLLRGLMAEVEEPLREFAEGMGPALQDLQGMVGKLGSYHAPEILPNGDILIRRKVPLPSPGEVEL